MNEQQKKKKIIGKTLQMEIFPFFSFLFVVAAFFGPPVTMLSHKLEMLSQIGGELWSSGERRARFSNFSKKSRENAFLGCAARHPWKLTQVKKKIFWNFF